MAGKARVHELAKELGVTSKEVLNKLAEQGEYVKSASSTVEAPVARRHPVIRRLVRALVHEGALHAAMSGSGSAVFGVFEDVAAARAAEEALARFGWDVIRTRTLSRAAVARERRRVLAGD